MAEQLHHEQAIPRSHQLIKAATAVILGGALMVLSGLTLAGTVIGLTIATPLMVIFSPVLVPAVISIVLVMTGFLFSGGCGMASISVFSWMYKFLTGKSPPGADKLEQAHRQIASKARDMKERAEQYGHAQGRVHEGTQGS